MLGRAGGPTGAIIFAGYIEETGSPVSGGKIWTVEYQPLKHPDTSNSDDALNLLNKVFIGTSQDLLFSLANAPSGQNLFLMFTTANPTVVNDVRSSTPPHRITTAYSSRTGPPSTSKARPVAPRPSAPIVLSQNPYCGRILPVPIRLPKA
ncbi:hypothetical protein HB13667_19255 [Pseudomonas putida]|uniref:Uncharacterized protein n=1 Tax=Pseudomonas putida TaxID=303 RepID=A0A0P7D809_PSEPU|nr:hypothetical protein B479_05895 [Pseudomonas putida HB3267]KPM61862.1 hypothetical protein HB13667_19255 [Pseudomonas putida]GJB77580.1 hypothetical protein KAM380_020450 [Aeromonas caviae]